jgi:CubicO group peptidase (beta-lactamase class C family)
MQCERHPFFVKERPMVLIPHRLLGGLALWHRRIQLMSGLAAGLCLLLASCNHKVADPVARQDPANETAIGQKVKQNIRDVGEQDRTKETFRDIAARMVKAINAADYEGVRKEFNKEMLEAFTVDKCRAFFGREIAGKYGKINKLETPHFNSATEATFVAHCERGTLDFTLTLDDHGQVAGMEFRPRSDAARTEETFRDVAGRMVKAINAADYDGIRKEFDKEMLEAFSLEKCRTFFGKEIGDKYGKINKLETPHFNSAAEATFVARCDRGTLDFTLILNGQGKVAGMLFRPHSDGNSNLNSRQGNYAGVPRSDGPSGAWLADLITDLRKQKQLVGLAAIVTVDGQVVASASDGERETGSGVSIELGDRWHLGSITKSITATMIARLVESGRMKWTDTIGERFAGASIHEDWKAVTLQQLLTHTSGAPVNFSLGVKLKQPALGPECTKERRKAVLDVIAEKPAQLVGQKYAYSNVGYTIAGAMAESATGVSWEDLVKREVFEPLKLTDAGFGPPKVSTKSLDQPRGHQIVLGSKVSVSDNKDNTPIMGPAGAIHMTLRDACTYATEHLRGERGTGRLLATETFRRLHTPELGDYAYGWGVKQPTEDIPHTVYWHNGSNTMWCALVVFIPKKNLAVIVTSNDGDLKTAEPAAWKVVNACANQFNVKNVPSK